MKPTDACDVIVAFLNIFFGIIFKNFNPDNLKKNNFTQSLHFRFLFLAVRAE